MLGSILSNILLVLGMSFTAAGFYFTESTFQATAAQASSSLLTLAGITLVIPAAYHSSSKSGGGAHSLWPAMLGKDRDGGAPNPDSEDLRGLLVLSRGTAVILLATYIAYLFFQLKTHSDLFEAEVDDDEEEEVADMDMYSAAGWWVADETLLISGWSLLPLSPLSAPTTLVC